MAVRYDPAAQPFSGFYQAVLDALNRVMLPQGDAPSQFAPGEKEKIPQAIAAALMGGPKPEQALESGILGMGPMPLGIRGYHGTNVVFDKFNPQYIDISTKHPSSQLGFFFSPDKRVARSFGENVIEAILSIKNPYILKQKEYAQLNTKSQAIKLKNDLIKKGYDGVYYEYGNEWIPFNINQIEIIKRER